MPPAEYAPSTVAWVRDEVEHIERTGTAWGDRPVVLLSTVGARTGLLRKTPLMRVTHGGVYAVVASAAGAARHPAWYTNVLAHPEVGLRDSALDLTLVAREVTGAERSRWWSAACTVFPSFVEYQRRTRRRIPVLLLEPTPTPTPALQPGGAPTAGGGTAPRPAVSGGPVPGRTGAP